MEEDELTTDELAEENGMELDAIKELLIQKGIMSQDEIDNKVEELYPDED